MTKPKCPHCGSEAFQLTTIKPEGAKFDLCLVHCASCGAPAGLTEAQNVPQIVREIHESIGEAFSRLRAQISDLEGKLIDH